jgi:hypothetical protein
LYLQELCDNDEVSEQSEAKNLATLQDSVDLFISSPMESAQECWLNSNPALQNALKQQSNEGNTEAQSISKLQNEAPSDNKLSGTVERDDTSLKQSKLRGGAQTGTKHFSSPESDSVSLKQSSLEAGESIAKQMWHSTLDSIPSKHMKKISSFKLKGKHSTGKTILCKGVTHSRFLYNKKASLV